MPSAVILEIDRSDSEERSELDNFNSEEISSICINPAFRDDNANLNGFQGNTSSFAEELKTSALSSLKHLLNMYSLQMDGAGSLEEGNWENSHQNATEKTVVSSGGVQQLTNKKTTSRSGSGIEEEQNTEETNFMSRFPDDLYLQIFSYLSAKDLCRVSTVCKRWERLSADNVLWQKKLDVDMNTWHVISHVTNPQMFKDCQSEYTSKEIYLRCSPIVNRSMRQQNYGFHQLSSILRSLLPRRVPRVAMFGPGLEMSTSPIVRKILQDKTGLFKATGMFPGKFDGVGSGFTLRMESGDSFHLMALYTSTQHEREALRAQHQDARALGANRMLQAAAPPPNAAVARGNDDAAAEEGDAARVYELRPSIRELARTLDAVVFVVDATADVASMSSGYVELRAMLNELWSQPGVPVLILSCVPDYRCARISCVDVVRVLHLTALNRPWQVCDCVVDSLAGVAQAFTWLVQQVQRT